MKQLGPHFISAILVLTVLWTFEALARGEPKQAPTPIAEEMPAYDRRSWGNWKDFDRNCYNTRAEVLIRDNYGKLVRGKNCVVKSGRWLDFYTGQTITSAASIDIDHVVSVKEAHDAGGWAWPREKKSEFYNDPDNLVVTHNSTNRRKGANSFLNWMPADKIRACGYAIRWMKIKRKYDLPFSQVEVVNFNALACAYNFNDKGIPELRPGSRDPDSVKLKSM